MLACRAGRLRCLAPRSLLEPLWQAAVDEALQVAGDAAEQLLGAALARSSFQALLPSLQKLTRSRPSRAEAVSAEELALLLLKAAALGLEDHARSLFGRLGLASVECLVAQATLSDLVEVCQDLMVSPEKTCERLAEHIPDVAIALALSLSGELPRLLDKTECTEEDLIGLAKLLMSHATLLDPSACLAQLLAFLADPWPSLVSMLWKVEEDQLYETQLCSCHVQRSCYWLVRSSFGKADHEGLHHVT